MAATITLSMDDKTGPAWDAFKKNAQAAGVSAKNLEASMVGVNKELQSRAAQQHAADVKRIADQYDGTAAAARRVEHEANQLHNAAEQRKIESYNADVARQSRLADLRKQVGISGPDPVKIANERARAAAMAGGGSGQFAEIGRAAAASNLFMGHEMQIRQLTGLMDKLPIGAIKVAGAISGIGVAAYGSVKAMQLMADYGNEGAQQILKGFSAVGNYLNQKLNPTVAGLSEMLGGHSMSAIAAHAEEFRAGIANRGANNALSGEARQRGIGENMAGSRRALDAAYGGVAEQRRAQDLAGSTNMGDINHRLATDRQSYDATVARNAKRLQDLEEQKQRAESAGATAKAYLSADPKETGKALPGETATDTNERNRRDRAGAIKGVADAEAKVRDILIEQAELKDREAKQLGHIVADEERKVALYKEQKAIEASRREESKAALEEGAKARRRMEEQVNQASLEFFRQTQGQRQSLLAEERDREFKWYQEGRTNKTSSEADRQAAQKKIAALGGDIRKAEDETYQKQVDQINASKERHQAELKVQQELKAVATKEQDSARTEELRSQAQARRTKALEKERELTALIASDNERAAAAAAGHAQSVNRLAAQQEAMARADQQAEADRTRQRIADSQKNVLDQTNAGLTGGDGGGMLGGFKSGIDRRQIVSKIADQRAKEARDKYTAANAGNITLDKKQRLAGEKAAGEKARRAYLAEQKRGGPNTDAMIKKRRGDALRGIRERQAKDLKGTKGKDRAELEKQHRIERKAAANADYTQKNVDEGGLDQGEVAKAQQDLLEQGVEQGVKSGKIDGRHDPAASGPGQLTTRSATPAGTWTRSREDCSLTLHLEMQSTPGGPFSVVNIQTKQIVKMKVHIGYSHPSILEMQIVAPEHSYPLGVLNFLRLWDDADSFQSAARPLFEGFIEQVEPGGGSNLVNVVAYDPTAKASSDVTIMSLTWTGTTTPTPATGAVPRLVFNSSIDNDDDFMWSRGQYQTLGTIMATIFDDQTLPLIYTNAAPVGAPPYYNPDLLGLALIPQEKLVFESESIRSAMERCLRYAPAWRMLWYPGTRQWRFGDITQAPAVTITLNKFDNGVSGLCNVLTFSLKPSLEGRCGAFEIFGPAVPVQTYAKLSDLSLTDISDNTLLQNNIATCCDVQGKNRWQITDPTLRNVLRLLQVPEDVQYDDYYFATTFSPTLLGHWPASSAGNAGWRVINDWHLNAKTGVIEINSGNFMYRYNQFPASAHPNYENPDDVQFIYATPGTPITVRSPTSGFSGTAFTVANMRNVVRKYDEMLAVDYEYNQPVTTPTRLAAFQVLADLEHTQRKDIVYAGSLVLQGLHYDYRFLNRRINLAGLDGGANPLLTGWEAIGMFLTDVEYDFNEQTTTLTCSSDQLELMGINPEQLKNALRIVALQRRDFIDVQWGTTIREAKISDPVSGFDQQKSIHETSIRVEQSKDYIDPLTGRQG